MDAMDTHEYDQERQFVRDHSEALARDVAAHYRTLVAEGVPEALADSLTERFAASWLDTGGESPGIVLQLSESED